MSNNMTYLEDIHKVEFDILCKCKAVCEKYNIPYYLCYGTLLGAIRHKGFIPWDDDIDIMMPAESIAEFKMRFTEEYGEPYFYSDIDTERICLEPWAKIRRSDTTSMPKILRHIKANWGICIDIFPIYPMPDSKILQKLRYAMAYLSEGMLRSGTVKYKNDSSLKLRIMGIFPYCIRKAVSKLIIKMLSTGNKDSKYIFDGFMIMKRSDIMSKNETASFEGEYFSIPSDAHRYLTDAYGDYMQLPPENERTGHASDNGKIIWDTEKSYLEYVGENNE